MIHFRNSKNSKCVLVPAAILLMIALVLPIFSQGDVYAKWSDGFVAGHSGYSRAAKTEGDIYDLFPESYWPGLLALKKQHPNWQFKAFYTGTDWEACFKSTAEMEPVRNLVYFQDANGLGITKEWYATDIQGAYNWAGNYWTPYDSGLWYQASEKAVRYCMDPRNFFDDTQIFQFLESNASIAKNEAESTAIVKRILEKNGIAHWLQSAEDADIYYETVEDNPEYEAYLLRKAEEESRAAEEASIAASLSEAESNAEGSEPSSEGESAESSESASSEESEEPTEEEIPPEKITVKHYMTYAEALGRVCTELGANEPMIVSRLLQEQGQGTSPLISGTRIFTVTKGSDKNKEVEGGYYQYFNIGASGNTVEEIINNGLTEAYIGGWDTRYKALYGGVQTYLNTYVKRRQSTLYTQKYNVASGQQADLGADRQWWGQYMQNITAPQTECRTLRSTIVLNGSLEDALVFSIPVFSNMPDEISKKPTDNRNPNNKIGSVFVDGNFLPDFDPEKTAFGTVNVPYEENVLPLSIYPYAGEASVSVTNKAGTESVTYEPSKTVFEETLTMSNGKSVTVKRGAHGLNIALFTGLNEITVKCTAENGEAREYAFSVLRAEEPETSSDEESSSEPESSSEEPSSEEPEESSSEEPEESSSEEHPDEPDGFGPGDVNQDGEIDIIDIAELRSHVFGYKLLSGIPFKLGDLDRDAEITIFDIAPIRAFVLGFTDRIEYSVP